MALQLIVDSLDSVPEAHRELYAEADGKFRLSVDGIEDTKGLKTALEKERQAARDSEQRRKDFEKRYEGIDPEKMKTLASKFESDEEKKLLDDGKLHEVFEKRTERLRADLDKQLKEALSKTEQAEQRANQFSQRVLDNHIRAAAAKVGIHSHAIEDALYRGRNMFALDENGDAIQFGSDGSPIFGKDGKTPFSPAEWLENMKETAPHWFPASSSGSGSAGANNGGASGAKTIKRMAFEQLSPPEKVAYIKSGGKIND